MSSLSVKAARKLRKAQKKSRQPLSLADRERLRNKVLKITPSESWTDDVTSIAESAGFRATTAHFADKLRETGIFPPPGDRVHMCGCDACRHIFPPTYVVSVFRYAFQVCQDCGTQPSVSDHETHSVRDAKQTVLIEILKNANLKDTEIAALCHQWDGMSQRGVAVLMRKSKTWVRQLTLQANAKLRAAGIQLPDPPKPPTRRPELQYVDSRTLEKLAAK